MKTIKALLFFLLIIGISACHKDKDDFTKTVTDTPDPTIYNELIGDILGYVYDEDNNPVANASVSIYSGTTTTNEFGIFTFKDKKLDTHGTYLKVEKDGYFLGSDYVYPKTGKNVSYVQMLSLDITTTFDATNGGTINVEGGGTITFNANSIADVNGNPYNGTVSIVAKRLSPSDPKIGNKMPGDLRAIDSDGATVVLASYAMVAVELFDDTGNSLNIQDGKTAHIEFSISADAVSDAPETIPLWYFDEAQGLWIEEGSATKVGNTYKGDVSHFSWWNCDAPFPLVHMCVNVLYDNGDIVNNLYAQIFTNSGLNAYAYIYDGNVCGKIPKGEVLTINIGSWFCADPIYTASIGPFDNDVVLDDIVLPIPDNIGGGKVVCGTDSLPGAQVILNYESTNGNGSMVVWTGNDGSFQLSNTILSCGDITSYSLFSFDPVTLQSSPLFVGDINNPDDNIILNVCGSAPCALSVSFSEINPTGCQVESIVVTPTGGNGTYSYLWANGETSNTLNVSSAGNYFVTVTDTDGCEVNQGYNTNVTLYAEYTAYNCDMGEIYITAFGTAPYIYELNGDTNVDGIFNNLATGSYCYSVSDANGCIFTECFEMFVAPSFLPITLTNCQDSLYTFDNYNASSLYTYSDFVSHNYFGPTPVIINVLEYGYSFSVSNEGGEYCDYYVDDIQLPFYEGGLTSAVMNTTCTSCDDGQIVLIPDFSANCIDCNPGTFEIYVYGSNLSNDLSAINTAHQLPAGNYIVILKDLDTGCYIGNTGSITVE